MLFGRILDAEIDLEFAGPKSRRDVRKFFDAHLASDVRSKRMNIENHGTEVLAGFLIVPCERVEQRNASGEFFSRCVAFDDVVAYGPCHPEDREGLARVRFELCSEDLDENTHRYGAIAALPM